MTEDPQPLILSTVDLTPPPGGRRFWLDDGMFPLDDEGMHVPRYSVQEVSKCFFGQGPDWLRWRMRPDKPSKRTGESKHPQGFFLLDGKPLEFKRLKARPKEGETEVDPNKTTARYYTLADIEKMAYALAQQGVIDGVRLSHIILIVRCVARLYGVTGGREVIPGTTEDEEQE